MLNPLFRPAAVAGNDRLYGGSPLDLPTPPALDFDFVGRPSLIYPGLPSIVFTRASTATRVNAAGLIETTATDAPRFDHHPMTGARLGLLFEEARTNLVLHSEDFAHAAWTKDNAAAGVGAPAPDGGTGAQLLAEDTGSGQHRMRQDGVAFSAGATLTISCFLRAAGRGFATLQFGAANGFRACFDLTAGTLAPSFAGASFGTGTFTAAGIQRFPGGWYRCWVVGNEDAAATSGEAYLNIVRSAAYTDSYAGDGASGVRAWGYQVEAGLFPTSYIATADATAARAVDVATVSALAPWAEPNSGTFYAESSVYGGDATNDVPIHVDDGTNDNRIAIIRQAAGLTTGVIFSDGVQQAAITAGSWTINYIQKVALAYAKDDMGVAVNSVLVGMDNSVILPENPTTLRLGNNAVGTTPLTGYVRRVVYWPLRLSNHLLQCLSR